jgi:hypothetical protein
MLSYKMYYFIFLATLCAVVPTVLATPVPGPPEPQVFPPKLERKVWRVESKGPGVLLVIHTSLFILQAIRVKLPEQHSVHFVSPLGV